MHLKRGSQIAYIPDHAKELGIDHPDVEYGFVNSISPVDNETIFCLYWLQGTPGKLRTTANSEATNIRDLILYDMVSPELVQEIIGEIDKDE
jgi:hypothetical protein